jgi:hypothetical protein
VPFWNWSHEGCCQWGKRRPQRLLFDRRITRANKNERVSISAQRPLTADRDQLQIGVLGQCKRSERIGNYRTRRAFRVPQTTRAAGSSNSPQGARSASLNAWSDCIAADAFYFDYAQSLLVSRSMHTACLLNKSFAPLFLTYFSALLHAMRMFIKQCEAKTQKEASDKLCRRERSERRARRGARFITGTHTKRDAAKDVQTLSQQGFVF